ncbi:hypothetical protein [Variovorax sp. RA8]|uniref:hypothetical protein n=1 Tax=Variovorax sp. (strain JCM 16519 / RA8) TaxID=662548 RepID=UPI001E2A982B|nr:hypothetical protein [Variovorax sp. RA8]
MAVDEALASSRQAVAAIEAQMHTQQQESARLLSDSEAEVRRLRKAFDETVASKEALREKAAIELAAAQRDAKEAEQRHVAHERRLLADVDRERVAARQAAADLTKEQKARAADHEAARSAHAAAKQALQAEKAAHREAAAAWSKEQQEMRVELATLRERAAGAEQRAKVLAIGCGARKSRPSAKLPDCATSGRRQWPSCADSRRDRLRDGQSLRLPGKLQPAGRREARSPRNDQWSSRRWTCV